MGSEFKIKKEECLGVSIVIPAKNEERYIGSCLDSLLKQNFKGPVEIIVVDNMSTDRTSEIAAAKQVHVFRCVANSPAAVRNFGASKARYPILAFIDSDCVAPCGWLALAVSSLESNIKLAAVGGPCFVPRPSNWVVKAWAPIGTDQTGRERVAALSGSNLIVRRGPFEAIDGFDESLITAEDDDLCRRLLLDGYLLESAMECAVTHFGYPQSLIELVMKSYWHGTTQLKAHGFLGDKLVILTWVWLLIFLFSLISLLFFPISFTILLTGLLFIVPGGLALARLKRNTLLAKLAKLMPTYVVCLVVIVGRSAGMLRELFLKVGLP